MQNVLKEIENKYKKHQVVDVRSGDTVRVHQKIKEGDKERVQVFEGLVIKTSRKNSATSSITVRRIASGIGVERTFKIHSPLIEKIEVTKRSDVNRNYLSYMRKRSGKSARLASVEADFAAINKIEDIVEEKPEAEAEQLDSEKTEKKPAANASAEDSTKPEAKEEESQKDSEKSDKTDE